MFFSSTGKVFSPKPADMRPPNAQPVRPGTVTPGLSPDFGTQQGGECLGKTLFLPSIEVNGTLNFSVEC